MFNQKACSFAGAVTLAVLLAAGTAAGQDQKVPPKKADPFKALKDAFAKGVTTTTVEPKDLPKAIADGVAKQVPGAAIKKAEKQEIKLTLQYVAFEKAKVQSYQAILVKDEKRLRLQFGPDGKKRGIAPAPADKKADAPAKEGDIPAKAVTAVKAIKALYPDAVVKQITTEVYQDPTGIVDVLTYEIEFITKGTEKEMVASPQGVIPHLWNPIAAKDLPKDAQATLAQEVGGGKLESVARYELRAGLNFVPLEKPRILYRIDVEKAGKTSTLRLRVDGSPVPPPVMPGKKRAFLGVKMEMNTTTIAEVTKDGPADVAGLKAGDRILTIGAAKIGAVPDILRTLETLQPGREAVVQIQRGAKMLTVRVKLGGPPG